jgi:hypothetical protein
MPLALGHDFELPDDAITQRFGFLARTGAGKTYAAGKLVEELVRLGGQVIILDPVGVWYGLRLAADGKRPGLTIPVFGGLHGDVELAPTQGERLAQLLIERALSGVVDVSAFRKGDRKRFVTDFAERLFHEAKRKRAPRMLVLEEAQVFAPQRAQGEERMLGAVEDLVRLGRNYGIGVTMISQRPQSVNKEILNQVECLVVGQLNAVHERKAIEDWVVTHDGDRKWVQELPELAVGTMVVWSPQWLKTFRKVRIGKKRTYDASATPELGEVTAEVKPLAQLDVDELRKALAPPAPPAKKGAPAAVPTAERTALTETRSELARVRGELTTLRLERKKVVDAIEVLGQVIAGLQRLFAESAPVPVEPRNFFLNERQEVHEKKTNGASHAPAAPPAKRARAASPSETPGELGTAAVRMLRVLATFHPGTLTKKQLARAAKMKASGGYFGAAWGQLQRQALIEQVAPSLYAITRAGLDVLGEDTPAIPKDREGRIAYWLERLKPSEQRMLRLVVEAGDMGLTREELAELLELSAGGGYFGGALGTLTQNRLVESRDGRLGIHPWLAGET